MAASTGHLLARIDAGAVAHNCRVLRGLIPPSCRMCVAIKSNAYGHGVAAVLPGLRAARVEMLCVATIDEARELVELAWEGDILLLGSEFSVFDEDERDDVARWLVEHRVRLTPTRERDVEALANAAGAAGEKAILHLMLDSGMGRMGLRRESLLRFLDAVRQEDRIEVEGLYTHLATADEEDKTFAREQLERFASFVSELGEGGVRLPILHCANSGATIDLPESHYDMIRPGISVYGYHSSDRMRNRPDLRPALRLVTYLSLVKVVPKGGTVGYGCTHRVASDTTIGIVPVGYADGYDRRLSNNAVMDIAGRAVPVIGRVSMDQVVLDLTPLVADGIEAVAGQDVTVISDDREQPNSVESLAASLGTIPNEIVTRLGERVKRVGA